MLMDYCKLYEKAVNSIQDINNECVLLKARRLEVLSTTALLRTKYAASLQPDDARSSTHGDQDPDSTNEIPNLLQGLEVELRNLEVSLDCHECMRDAWEAIISDCSKLCALSASFTERSPEVLEQAASLLGKIEISLLDALNDRRFASCEGSRGQVNGVMDEVRWGLVALCFRLAGALEEQDHSVKAIEKYTETLSLLDQHQPGSTSDDLRPKVHQRRARLYERCARNANDLNPAIEDWRKVPNYRAAMRLLDQQARDYSETGDPASAITAHRKWFTCIDDEYKSASPLGIDPVLRQCKDKIMQVENLGRRLADTLDKGEEEECYRMAHVFLAKKGDTDGVEFVERRASARGFSLARA